MATFDLADYEQFTKQLQFGLSNAARKGLLSAALRTANLIQTRIIPNTKPEPVDRGRYKAGWLVKKTSYGASLTNSVPYASMIELGVRAANVKPGRAMLKALAEWAQRKGLGKTIVQPKAGKSLGKANAKAAPVKWKKATDSAAMRIAWAIAMSMKRKGIFNGGTGLLIFAQAEVEIPNIIREEVAREIKRAYNVFL